MIDSAKLAGQPPVADSLATAKPVAPPPKAGPSPTIAADTVAVTQKHGGVPAVSLVEEPNRKAGVTFKNMLKAANAAADKGFTEQATPLYNRAVGLAEDAGDLAKVIKAADDQAYAPVVKQALDKGLQLASRVGDLEDLAKLADKRGLRPQTEALVDKAIETTSNGKDLRKIAAFAADHKLETLSQKAYAKIAGLPGGH